MAWRNIFTPFSNLFKLMGT